MNTAANKHKPIISVIAHSIDNDEQGIKNLLKRNGVDTSFIRTKFALREAFFNALEKSKGFALDFNKYVEDKKKASGFANVVANDYGFGDNLNLDDFKLDAPNSTGMMTTTSVPNTATNPTNGTVKTGFFAGLNLKDLINTGVNILEIQRDVKVSADNKDAIKTAVQIKQEEANYQPTAKSTSTATYVVVGLIGVALIGGLIYVLRKK
jgi:hypothetical protein